MEKFHKEVMEAIQTEWEKNQDRHTKFKDRDKGIRSSQVSSVVGFLIDLGIITPALLATYKMNKENGK